MGASEKESRAIRGDLANSRAVEVEVHFRVRREVFTRDQRPGGGRTDRLGELNCRLTEGEAGK